MNRRTFLGTLAGALLAAPLAAEAQQAGKAYHIGVIDPGPPKFKRAPRVERLPPRTARGRVRSRTKPRL